MIKLITNKQFIIWLLSFGISLSIPSITLAVAYNFPGNASAPLNLGTGDTLSVDSGTMQTTNTTNYTVQMGQGTTVTVQSGAALSYNSPGFGLATILGNPSVGGASTRTITNSGTISKGNATYSIYINNMAGNQDFVINNNSAIVGDIALLTIRNATINFDANASLLGNLALNTTGLATVNFGANSAVNFTSQGTMDDIDLIEIYSGSSLTVVTNFTNIGQIINNNNATLSIYSTLSGTAGITNSGTINIGANLNCTGAFNTTGTVNLTGNYPTSVLSSALTTTNIFTSTYSTLGGTHIATLNNIYNFGQANFIFASPQFANFQVAYTGGYFAEGDYTLVLAPTIGGAPAAYTVPAATLFLNFNTPTVVTNTIVIHLDRTPFQTYATQGITKSIGQILEVFGANQPNTSQLALLNGVEASNTPLQLQNSLRQLAPLISAPLYTFMLQDQSLEQVGLRIVDAKRKKTYSSGEKSCDLNIWFRALGDRANQNETGNTMGYYANTGGGVAGLDKFISPCLLLGGGLSVTMSTVIDKINPESSTRVTSYQALFYGSYDILANYTNWTLALANNHFQANRHVDINGYVQNASGGYSNQQFGGKFVFGRSYRPSPFVQISPEASGLFTVGTGYNYHEGAGNATNLTVLADSANMIQLTAGFKFEFPSVLKQILYVPEFHVKGVYNAVRGTQNMVCNFQEGGAQFYSRAGLPITGIRYGASLTMAKVNKFEFKLNWDRTAMDGYTDNMLYLDMRYTF
jgi:uncharacterized protein with beta-barrel porin domain